MNLKSNRGFISLDVLFSLFVLSLVSLLFIYVLNNNMKYIDKNRLESELRLESQNIIDSLNNDEDNRYLNMLKTSSKISIREGNIILDLERKFESEKLWKLYIKSYHKNNLNLMSEWVIVIEKPQS